MDINTRVIKIDNTCLISICYFLLFQVAIAIGYPIYKNAWDAFPQTIGITLAVTMIYYAYLALAFCKYGLQRIDKDDGSREYSFMETWYSTVEDLGKTMKEGWRSS